MQKLKQIQLPPKRSNLIQFADETHELNEKFQKYFSLVSALRVFRRQKTFKSSQ